MSEHFQRMICEDGVATARDPHHGGATEWRYDHNRRRFFHRANPMARWVEVKRVSLTPDRVLLLAKLVKEAQHG